MILEGQRDMNMSLIAIICLSIREDIVWTNP